MRVARAREKRLGQRSKSCPRYVFETPVTDCICHWALAGGRVVTIVDGRRVAVPGAPASVGIAASRGRVAFVPGAATWEGGDSARAAPNGPVEVRDALTGAVIATVSPVGTVRAVALSGVRLATLSYDAGVKRVDIWDITTQRFSAPSTCLRTQRLRSTLPENVSSGGRGAESTSQMSKTALRSASSGPGRDRWASRLKVAASPGRRASGFGRSCSRPSWSRPSENRCRREAARGNGLVPPPHMSAVLRRSRAHARGEPAPP